MKSSTLAGGLPKQNYFSTLTQAKRNSIIEVIAALFILLFMYTALSKSFDIKKTIGVVKQVPFFSHYALLISWGVVIIEYLTSILLFIPKTKKAGLYLSFCLLLLFTIYIALMIAFVPKLPCSCGGVISKMSWKQHLGFNVTFMLLGIIGIVLYKEPKSLENKKVIFT
jgi:hypothetical protein